jgi:putative tryptophan/tyrosine transport system substrate-binding protein
VTMYTRRQVMQGIGAVGLGLLAGCGRWPGQGQARPRMPRIGYLHLGSAEGRPQDEAFRQALRELGYVEGQSITLEYRYTEIAEQLPALAAELVHLNVDLIVAGGVAVVQAAKQATDTVPIVMASSNDPVASGLVASLARPGGNVTGLTNLSTQMPGKWLQLLKESVPEARQVAILLNPTNLASAAAWGEAQVAARTLGVQLQSLEARGPDDLASALEAATADGADGLVVSRDTQLNSHRRQIAALAAKHRLPAISGLREFAVEGLLMAYGPNLSGSYRRAAGYVDKILKGMRPADLPVEQPREFDFMINLRTAQALGLTIPHHVLLQATEVIQ